MPRPSSRRHVRQDGVREYARPPVPPGREPGGARDLGARRGCLGRREGKRRGGSAHGDERARDWVVGEGVREDVDRAAARGLPEHGDAAGVAAEAGDIVADPLGGQALVEDARVLCRAEGPRETPDVEPVIK